uniref:Uncharacterized protein n=1 Tax=Dictyoglomus turgidum TaxID=513050 RepID=A0A7C3WVI9_9BACT
MLKIEEIHIKDFYTFKSVEDKMDRLGLAYKTEIKMPTIPARIDALSDSELGRLYSEVLEYFNFIIYQFSVAKCEKLESDNRLKYVTSKLKKENDKNFECNPAYVEVLLENQKINQLMIMLEAAKTMITKRLAVISRLIEVRKLEWDKNKRDTNVNKFMPFIDSIGDVDEE